MEEIWKDIPGYEGRYQASTTGYIRSLDRVLRCGRGGNGLRLMKGRILRSAGQKTDPHLRVVLEHKGSGQLVHRLVALTFLGPCPAGMEVLHTDGNPLNNDISNLRYGTRRDNILDVLRIGKAWRRITAEQALDIRRRLQAGERGRDIAKSLGVSDSLVSAIKTGRTFGWLKDDI